MKRAIESIAMEKGQLTAKDIRRLVGRNDPVILEIGANDGQTTLEFLRAMPKARVYCFEPDPRAILQFKGAVKSPKVKLFETAVGNKNGTILFHQSSGTGTKQDWNKSGSIRAPKDHLKRHSEVTFDKTIETPIVRLDDWAKSTGVGDIDFIWADIQGAEGDLLQGGMSVINRSRFLYTEYGTSELYEGQWPLTAIDAYLENFSIMRLFSNDVLFENLLLRRAEPPASVGTFKSLQRFWQGLMRTRQP